MKMAKLFFNAYVVMETISSALCHVRAAQGDSTHAIEDDGNREAELGALFYLGVQVFHKTVVVFEIKEH